jgi:hypothetical protein
MMRRTPVTFVNRNGQRLVGILEAPVNPPCHDVAMLLLPPGVKMRLGPEGIYRRLSEEFVRLGFPVLRFDFHGIGDSEGVVAEELLKDFYSHVESGRYVDDTIDALDWMHTNHGVTRFILAGLCGGAMTGLLTGARDKRVIGLLGLGITTIVSSPIADGARYISQGQLDRLQHGYIQKLLKPSAWLRFLTFKSDYRVLYRILLRLWKRPVQPPTPNAPAPSEPQDNSNPLFPPAFFQMLASKRPMFFVFGGSDRLGWEFEEKFVARYRDRLAQAPDGYQVHTIEHANHVFTFSEWQREMLEQSRRWLSRHFPDLVNAVRSVESSAAESPGRSTAGTANSTWQSVRS